jgi:hypothetical protein
VRKNWSGARDRGVIFKSNSAHLPNQPCSDRTLGKINMWESTHRLRFELALRLAGKDRNIDMDQKTGGHRYLRKFTKKRKYRSKFGSNFDFQNLGVKNKVIVINQRINSIYGSISLINDGLGWSQG